MIREVSPVRRSPRWQQQAAILNRHRTARAGFSLIEVMMATAFLMGSAIVLAKLAGMGRDQSQKAQNHLRAQQLCEQTLHELLLGLRPFEITEAAPLLPVMPMPGSTEERIDPVPPSPDTQFDTLDSIDSGSDQLPSQTEWQYAIRMEPLGDKPGMWAVTVAVEQADPTLERPVRFALTRWTTGPVPAGAFENLQPEDLRSGPLGDEASR